MKKYKLILVLVCLGLMCGTAIAGNKGIFEKGHMIWEEGDLSRGLKRGDILVQNYTVGDEFSPICVVIHSAEYEYGGGNQIDHRHLGSEKIGIAASGEFRRITEEEWNGLTERQKRELILKESK